MGIAQFTSALKDQAYRFWLDKLTPNVIRGSSRAIRKELESDPTKNNFLITDEKIRDMVAYVTDVNKEDVTDQTVQEAKQRMLQSVNNAKNAGVQFKVVKYSETEVVVEQINFQTMETMLENGFGKTKLAGWKRSVGSGFHRGHVLGIPTVLLNKTITEFENLKDVGEQNRKMLLSILQSYRAELARQDLLSSNMGKFAQDYEIYAKYLKNPDNFLIEMQVGQTNVESGSEAGKLVAEMKQFLDPAQMNAGILKNIVQTLKKPSVILDYLQQPGSPSAITLLVNKVMQPLSSTKLDVKEYKSPSVKVGNKRVNIKRAKADSDRYKKEIIKIDKAISELRNLKRKVDKIPATIDLLSLQNLINSSLQEQIRKNMGTGDRRDVLNYRTGRFAQSARVERLSESRQGMITAFYTYMKNPYATFSKGGRQEAPASRDPKLLISKSIRELAGPVVSNRMRAVLV